MSPSHVAALNDALQKTVARRRSAAYQREHEPAFAERLEGANARIFHLLDEDPLFLDLLDYAPMMAYVHGLFNDMPHLHSTDAFCEVEKGDYHGLGWHIDGIQDGFRHLGWPMCGSELSFRHPEVPFRVWLSPRSPASSFLSCFSNRCYRVAKSISPP